MHSFSRFFLHETLKSGVIFKQQQPAGSVAKSPEQPLLVKFLTRSARSSRNVQRTRLFEAKCVLLAWQQSTRNQLYQVLGKIHSHSFRTQSTVPIEVFTSTRKAEKEKTMLKSDLLIDPDIRVWVFLPIVVITFLVGVLRNYVTILLMSTKKVDLQQIQDSQALIRSRLLRENGKYLPKSSFMMRRHFFNNPESGYLTVAKNRPSVQPNPMNDPTMMSDMLKNNLTNMLPTILIGGWINWTFSGFVTTRVPFPLTLRFKPMLQRGIELSSLNSSWVSSASWYFLNVFGLRGIYTLVLGENNQADHTKGMQDQMSGAAMSMPADLKPAFKAEWEMLEIYEHQEAK